MVAQGTPSVIESILKETGLPQEAYENYLKILTSEAVESARTAGAGNDIETLGLDADEVKAVADEIDHMVEADEKFEKFSEHTNKNAGSLKKLAVAAEQTQKGYDALEKGYTD